MPTIPHIPSRSASSREYDIEIIRKKRAEDRRRALDEIAKKDNDRIMSTKMTDDQKRKAASYFIDHVRKKKTAPGKSPFTAMYSSVEEEFAKSQIK